MTDTPTLLICYEVCYTNKVWRQSMTGFRDAIVNMKKTGPDIRRWKEETLESLNKGPTGGDIRNYTAITIISITELEYD